MKKGRLLILTLLTSLFAAAALPAIMAQSSRTQRRHVRIAPQIPQADRRKDGRVILERADRLTRALNDQYMVVTGNVEFSKGAMLMFCDSAHYYPDEGSMDAFGNVRMEQGDTLFVYADELNYSGPQEVAYLYSDDPKRPVRLINRDVKLETDVFTYDLYREIGFYNTGGVLTDRRNRLTSIEGEYIPSTKEANFYTGVHLKSLRDNDTLDIYTDSLYYNTSTHIAEFTSPTRIVNGQGDITSTDGIYNTATEYAELYAHSMVRTRRGTTLEGDTLLYDRVTGRGEAFGNMMLVDSARQSALKGNYGYYDEIVDSAYVTGRALAMEYSKGDTLYMHGRYITSVLRIDSLKVPNPVDSLPDLVRPDSTHVLNAWPRVRFYRTDLQGICDSMAYVERDSMLYMHRHPVVWSEDRQIFGNVINVHMNDSTVDRVHLPDFGFSAQYIEDDFYNQLSGKEMVALLENGTMRRLDVSGNVEAIFFPEENDSTINKMVSVQSSFMTGWFENGQLHRMKMWPESQGVATPLYLARRSMLLLPKFHWFGTLRPRDADDVFVVSPEMDALMGEEPSTESEVMKADIEKPDNVEATEISGPESPEADTGDE